MKGLDAIAKIRAAGMKPKAVHVHLVASLTASHQVVSRAGSVTCELAAHESLSDLDLRPLVGLQVITADFSGNRERHRRLAKLIAQQEPSILCMFDGSTLYRRTGGANPQTEVIAL